MNLYFRSKWRHGGRSWRIPSVTLRLSVSKETTKVSPSNGATPPSAKTNRRHKAQRASVQQKPRVPPTAPRAVLLVAGDPPGGNGSVATGRCTYDFTSPTNIGLCQYTDGIGELAGFTARLIVAPNSEEADSYVLTGPYQFKDVNNQ